jgi:hypothetical protein
MFENSLQTHSHKIEPIENQERKFHNDFTIHAFSLNYNWSNFRNFGLTSFLLRPPLDWSIPVKNKTNWISSFANENFRNKLVFVFQRTREMRDLFSLQTRVSERSREIFIFFLMDRQNWWFFGAQEKHWLESSSKLLIEKNLSSKDFGLRLLSNTVIKFLVSFKQKVPYTRKNC